VTGVFGQIADKYSVQGAEIIVRRFEIAGEYGVEHGVRLPHQRGQRGLELAIGDHNLRITLIIGTTDNYEAGNHGQQQEHPQYRGFHKVLLLCLSCSGGGTAFDVDFPDAKIRKRPR
jgi:hypothetical protein